MIAKTVTYTDYNGVTRTETHHFHLNKAEITDMEMSVHGGLVEMLQKIIDAKDNVQLYKVFKDLILKSYGVKEATGRRFIKNETVLAEFVETEAYSQIFTELVQNAEVASAFVIGIMPDDLQQTAKEELAKNPQLLAGTN